MSKFFLLLGDGKPFPDGLGLHYPHVDLGLTTSAAELSAALFFL